MADQQVPKHTARMLAVMAAQGPYNMQPDCRRLVAAYPRCRANSKNIYHWDLRMDRTSELFDSSNRSLSNSADGQGVEWGKKKQFPVALFLQSTKDTEKHYNFLRGGQSFADFWFSHEVCPGNLSPQKEAKDDLFTIRSQAMGLAR